MSNTIQITITANNKASGALSDVNQSLGGLGKVAQGATGIFGKVSSAIGGMAIVAGGIIAADIFGKIASGLSSFATAGLEAVGNAQQLETSLKALLTANNMYEQATETTTAAVVKQLMTQDEYALKLDSLNAKLTTQQATYQEQQERIRQLTNAYGENGLNVIKAKAQHAQLAIAIRKTERDIASLDTTETSYNTTTKQVYRQVMNQADAFKEASKQTADLMDFISKVAVISPFETETVEMTTKYAIAAGLGVDATKEFVPAFLDLAGAVGITSSELGFAADQLFQVKKIGKLTQIDLRQLRRLGIDLGKIIGVEMGMSIDEFNKKAEESPEIFDDLFDAVTRFSQNTFAGTAKEMATSVKGLVSTLSDIFVIGGRNFWRPLVDAVTPMAAEILDTLSSFVLGGDMAQLGQRLADNLLGALSYGKSIFNIGKVLGIEAAIATVIQTIKNAWPNTQEALTEWGNNFWSFIVETVIPSGATVLGQAFADNLLSALSYSRSIFNIAKVLGIEAAVATVTQTIKNAWVDIQEALATWRDKFFNWVTELYPQIPTYLTELVTAISTAITDYWPTIASSLLTWSTQFWEWAETAALNVATGLAALGTAMLAWATSGEGQTALSDLGENIATVLIDMLKFNFENGEGALTVMTTLALGLAAAVGQIVVSLALIGGQVVAGIIAGILKYFGIDVEPVLISEFRTLVDGIGEDIKKIAEFIGEMVIEGASDGLIAYMGNLQEAITEVAQATVTAIKQELGIESPSTVFAGFGVDIVQGLIDGILSMAGSAVEAISTLLGGLLSGGGEGGEGPALFDPAPTLNGLMQINTFIQETIPLNLILLTEQFLIFTTALAEQLTMLTFGPLFMFIMTFSNIYLIHIPVMIATWTAMTTTIASQIMIWQTNVINLTATVVNLGTMSESAGKKAADGAKKAADKIKESWIPAVEKLIKAYDRLIERILKARSLRGGGGGGGEGRATGGPVTAGNVYTVGERGPELFVPFQNGTIIPNGKFGGQTVVNNTYNFNQTVNTRAESSSVIGDFKTMQLLVG